MAPVRISPLVLAALALCGCFSTEVLAPDRAVVMWRQAEPGRAHRAAGAGDSRALDLQAALALALRGNPSLRVLQARLAESKAEEGEAIQLDNPQLRINNIEVDRIAESRPELDLALRVPIPSPWVLDALSRRAKLATEEARARLEQGRRRLRRQIRRAFTVLATLAQEQQELQGSLKVLGKHVARVKQGLSAGAATRFDLATARLRQAEVADRLGAVKTNHGQTVSRLRRLVGVRPDRSVTFKTEALGNPPAGQKLDDRALIKQALKDQPGLREAAARVGQAQADAYIARAERWPWLRYAEVSYGFNPNMDPLNFELSVALDVPLLSFNSGRIEAREARLTRRRLEEKARLLQVARRVRKACESVRITRARLRDMERHLLPAVKDTGAALAEAAARGAIDPQDAIATELRRVRARRRYLRALRDHRLANLELDAAVGAKETR